MGNVSNVNRKIKMTRTRRRETWRDIERVFTELFTVLSFTMKHFQKFATVKGVGEIKEKKQQPNYKTNMYHRGSPT